MKLGNLTTNRTWAALMVDLKGELRKWGFNDFIAPNKTDSRNTGEVVVEVIGKDGQWHSLKCSRFGGGHGGPERNLCALVLAIEGYRKAEQRGIAGLFIEVAKLTALPSPDDPYHILGVAPGAGRDAVRTAYLRNIKTAHPDQGGTRQAFDRIRKAGEELGVT